MRIFLRVAIGMVHSMHHCIGPRDQVRRTLRQPGHKVKCTLPPFTGSKHLVRSIAVQEKRMEKKGHKPMDKKKPKNGYHDTELINAK